MILRSADRCCWSDRVRRPAGGDDLTARGVVGEPEDRGKLVLAAGGFGEHAPGFWGVLRCRGRSGRFLRCRRGGRGARERTGPVRPGGARGPTRPGAAEGGGGAGR